jgi:hypothetical protein
VNDGGKKLNLLLHAFRELVATLAVGFFKAHAREATFHSVGKAGIRQPFQAAHVCQKGADAHFSVHATLLGQVADSILGLSCG